MNCYGTHHRLQGFYHPLCTSLLSQSSISIFSQLKTCENSDAEAEMWLTSKSRRVLQFTHSTFFKLVQVLQQGAQTRADLQWSAFVWLSWGRTPTTEELPRQAFRCSVAASHAQFYLPLCAKDLRRKKKWQRCRLLRSVQACHLQLFVYAHAPSSTALWHVDHWSAAEGGPTVASLYQRSAAAEAPAGREGALTDEEICNWDEVTVTLNSLFVDAPLCF